MKTVVGELNKSLELRKRAEELMRKGTEEIPGGDICALVHELQTYQAELERQNEELRQAHLDLAESRDRYVHLYDFAPIGYLSFDVNGLILEANFTSARLLGKDRRQLIQQQFSGFVAPDFQDAFRLHLRQVADDRKQHVCELRLVRRDGSLFDAQLESMAIENARGMLKQLRTSITDISERKQVERALRESEERCRTSQLNIPAGVFRSTPSGKFISVNPCLVRMYGCDSEEELLGTSAVDFYCDPEQRRELVKSLKTQESVADFESRIRRKDGSIIRVSSNVRAVHDERGEIAHLDGIVVDITDRRRAEEALRESEEKFRLLSEQALLGILIIQDNMVRYANQAASEIYEYTVLEMLNWRIDEFAGVIHPDDRPMVMEQTLKKQSGSRDVITDCSYRILTRTGMEKWVDEYSKTIVFEGRPADFVTIVDITEHYRSVNELKRFSTAVDQSGSMICIADPSGTIEYVNPRFRDVTGYGGAEVIGRPVSILKSGKQDCKFYRALWNTIKSGKIWSGTMENRHKNGEIYWERKTISPIFDDDGKLINYLSVGEDMTNDVLTQQKLAESDKMAAIGTLAAGVAHEFRNYLAGIIGNATYGLEELEHNASMEVAKDTLSQVIEIGEKANDIAMSLLSYSKACPHKTSQEDLKEIIKRVVGLVEKELKVQSIEIVTHLEDVPRIELSASKIQQLLLNLLINAQQAMRSNGVMTISLASDDTSVNVKVSDVGVGIPQENLSRVFDPFFSTKGVWGKDEAAGLGMGLSICRNIAREHGGDLTVESSSGVGATFTLTLPLKS